MLLLSIVIIICLFVTLWVTPCAMSDTGMSFNELIRGKENSRLERKKIDELEYRINALENTVYISKG